MEPEENETIVSELYYPFLRCSSRRDSHNSLSLSLE